jgi:hypothetical protein
MRELDKVEVDATGATKDMVQVIRDMYKNNKSLQENNNLPQDSFQFRTSR